MSRVRVFTTLLVFVSICSLPARAHPVPFSYLDLHLQAGGPRGSLVVHVFDVAHELGIQEPATLLDERVARERSQAIATILQARLRVLFDGRVAKADWSEAGPAEERQSLRFDLRFADGAPPSSVRIEAALFPYDPNHQTFVNMYEGEALRHQAILDAKRRGLEYFSGTLPGRFAVVQRFVAEGIHHIAIGPDHVLFLIGLLLLGGSWRRLVAIVTAFTAGHSVTLTLAVLGLLHVPSAIVEPAIALSIVYVGADNLLVKPGSRDLRPIVALAFGLVHGFGFASVLREIGLPPAALGWSLFSFNLGVEMGQVVLVLAVASLLATVRARDSVLAQRLARVGSVVVVAAGAYWFVERVWSTGGSS